MSDALTPVTDSISGNCQAGAVDALHPVAPATTTTAAATTTATADRLAALLAANACPKTYSTAEVARFFGKTDQWVYWVLREGVTRADGSLIEPDRVGKSNRRRFTESIVEEIAVALYRRGTLGHDGACRVLDKLGAAEGLVA